MERTRCFEVRLTQQVWWARALTSRQRSNIEQVSADHCPKYGSDSTRWMRQVRPETVAQHHGTDPRRRALELRYRLHMNAQPFGPTPARWPERAPTSSGT